ncbi:hypothetical protein HDU67_001083 [Dinochytrium kinnereticum]|nr:hypothetical protein HDU67_001083 [Dinochytrium kinnereticum]
MNPPHTHPLVPLRIFVQEILKRSRASFSTLQLALLYIVRMRNKIAVVASPLARSSSFLPATTTATTNTTTLDGNARFPAVVARGGEHTCGRRMFLAALMVASKYLQDKNYSNRAWSKISGLPLDQVNTNEQRFLEAVGYELYVNQKTFGVWSSALIAKTCAIRGGGEALGKSWKGGRGRWGRACAISMGVEEVARVQTFGGEGTAATMPLSPVSPVRSVPVDAMMMISTETALDRRIAGETAMAMVSPPISPLSVSSKGGAVDGAVEDREVYRPLTPVTVGAAVGKQQEMGWLASLSRDCVAAEMEAVAAAAKAAEIFRGGKRRMEDGVEICEGAGKRVRVA